MEPLTLGGLANKTRAGQMQEKTILLQMWDEITSIVLIVFLSVFGGIVGYLIHIENTRGVFSIFALCAHGVIGGFVGLMVGLLADFANLNFYLAFFLSGMAAATWKQTWPILKFQYVNQFKREIVNGNREEEI